MGITIVTPTYNRGYIIENLYFSLCKQTNKNFEWVIVDDGSVDNTKELINKFIQENKIQIKYFYQKNSGKALAHNEGVKLASMELFTCVDSDDCLVENAVETILKRWEKIKIDAIGILAKRMTYEGKDITITNLKDKEIFFLREAYESKKLKGDTFIIFKTSIIKNYSFPKFNGEKFVPEDYLYDQTEKMGKLSFFNKSLYKCNYLKDGYTKNINKIIANNPKGYRAFLEQRIELSTRLKNKFINLIKYTSISFVIKEDFFHKNYRFMNLLTLIPGYLVYILRFKNNRK
ncbi:glycosyltransferase family A protein [Fusobacterium sp. SYSU M8D902]|uniref:glycosyltransferase family A protein n=1 Tax=Fusobacterium sp. SYSU M8D902 TaxID=3159562 RepID=UPI0032E3A7C7